MLGNICSKSLYITDFLPPKCSTAGIFLSKRGKTSPWRNWSHLGGWPTWPTWPTQSEMSASGCLRVGWYHLTSHHPCLILIHPTLSHTQASKTFSTPKLFASSRVPLLPDLPVASLNCSHKVLAECINGINSIAEISTPSRINVTGCNWKDFQGRINDIGCKSGSSRCGCRNQRILPSELQKVVLSFLTSKFQNQSHTKKNEW